MREDILLEDDSDLGIFSQWYTFLTPEELSALYDDEAEYKQDEEIFKKAVKASYGDTATYVGTAVCKVDYADKLIEAGYEYLDIITTPDGNIPIQETDEGKVVVITVGDINAAINGEWYDKPETPVEEQIQIEAKAPIDEGGTENHTFDSVERAKRWIKQFGIKKDDVVNYENITTEEIEGVLTEDMDKKIKLNERVFDAGVQGGKKKMFGKFAIYDNDGDGDVDVDDLRQFFMDNPDLMDKSGVPSYWADPVANANAMAPFREDLKEDDAEDRRAAARQKRADAKSKALVRKIDEIFGHQDGFVDYDEFINALFEVSVPDSGKADTVGGEIIRALTRVCYRYFNDGDIPFIGYGIETCGGSLQYLIDTCGEEGENIFDDVQDIAYNGDYDYDHEWGRYIEEHELEEKVLEFIEPRTTELFSTPNTIDSRRYDDSMMSDLEPVYEDEYEYPEELKWHIEKEHVSPSDILDDIESNSYTYGDGTYYAFDDYIKAEDVPYDIYQELEGNLNDLFDAWINSLNDEYGSMYDDEEEEDVEENLDNPGVAAALGGSNNPALKAVTGKLMP